MVGSLSVDNLDVIGSGDAELLVLLRVSPDVGVNLVHTVALYENILDSVLVGLKDFLTHGKKRAFRGEDIKIIVAVNTGDFLNDISLDGYVLGRSPGGNDGNELVALAAKTEAQRGKGGNDSILGDVYAGVAVNVFLVKSQGNGGIASYVSVGEGGNDLTARVVLGEKIKKSFGRSTAKLGVEHLLVSHRRVGSETESRGSLTHRDTVKGRGLKKKRACVVLNLGGLAAHNAGNSHGNVARGNHQHILVDISYNAVKSLKFYAVLEGLHLDFINLSVIKGVHGLTQLHHNVVGKIGKEINGS